MRVRSGRATIDYELEGAEDAPSLLMIRGLMRSRRHWGALVGELAPRFRLILMDNRGVGLSSAPLPPYTTRQMADDALSVLDAARVARAYVFGVSLGGMIAQELALRSGDRVDRLVLGCTRSGRRGPSTPLPVVMRLLAAFRLSPEAAVEHTAPLVVGDRFLVEHPEVLSEWKRLARDQRPRRRGLIGQLAAVLLHDATERLRRIACPTLVVTGDRDRMILPQHSEHIARAIPGARLQVLNGARHDFSTELPRETAELLTAFLLGAPTRS